METLRDWLAEHPPPDARFTQTVAGVATRVQAGEDLRFAVPGVARGFRPTALRESPAAFRRRGIFIARGALTRV